MIFDNCLQENAIDHSETVNEALLEGHLGLARELILPLSSEKKSKYGSDPEGRLLIKVKIMHRNVWFWLHYFWLRQLVWNLSAKWFTFLIDI